MSDVGANIFAEGVVPEYVVLLSVFSAFAECFLVWRGGLVKLCLVE